ncbi:conserved membrane hypothetical protein [uncultured delta proteobacterium]|uniref:ABC transmembrane type-1 domain-containing protein n=1 Tax=uncultured delta proteobacterium TaxID=34034 RepID=A0A212JAN8_9DELT|nr:conserved membrane hypothetical protein [uncultured delta proteobacterium]
MLEEIAAYFTTNHASFQAAVWEHVSISAASLGIALAVGAAGGVLCVWSGRANVPVQSVFQTLRIVPSLAVLLLLIPIMGTGIKPAVTALVLLAIPPIFLNTVAGLRGVPEFMLETAAGMGMTPRQAWRKVRLPLAMPMILTGVKIAYVEIVASAALAAKIGAGGLGEIIFTGLGLDRADLLLIGGSAVALLALAGGCLFGILGKVLFRY